MPKTVRNNPSAKRGAQRAKTAAQQDHAANGDVDWLTIRGAAQNNLQTVDAHFPLARFTCVTGVSGSGKSSLVNEILYKALARDLNGAKTEPGNHAALEGLDHLDKIIAIDQTPIGRTPRSNPATYIKVFDDIRNLFTKLPDAKLRGYKPGRFSFNVNARHGGGRCEACDGNGANKLEMDFLADMWVTCPVCEGKRFTRETLAIQYKHKSIADVLEMDVQDALQHFENIPRVQRMLQTLHDVGLDYIKLGQPSPTLSGGEAQRIKLARELVKIPTGRTLYVLDEPTTGLHFEDIRKLLEVLHGFVDAGNTVVVIEHNLDVIKTADWVIDLGPEGGGAGGLIVAEGTPEEVAQVAESHTGRALAEELRPRFAPRRAARRSDAARPIVESSAITVTGARQHNLKDLSVSIPRDQLTVCTGVSGSGKTSFAIDTVFTEGYRRYVESLSAYARQFLGQMAKPRVDKVTGLSPAICIEQKAASKSPRSTVGTITEIYDYMRVLWARIGQHYCPNCNMPIGAQTVDEIVSRVFQLGPGAPIIVLAPVTLGDGETYAHLFQRLKNSGYTRVRIDGEIHRTTEATTLDARRKHSVAVVIDRTVVRDKSRGRIAEAIEHALMLGGGLMTLLAEAVERVPESDDENAPPADAEHVPEREFLYSQKLACAQCGMSYAEQTPHHFSFNSQLGWCETCEGLGVQRGAPAAAIIRYPDRSLFDGAIAGWHKIPKRTPLGKLLLALCEQLGVDADTPLGDWDRKHVQVLMFGTRAAGRPWLDGHNAFNGLRFHWRGFFPAIDSATRNSWSLRFKLHNVVTDIPCVECRGGRVQHVAASVRVGDKTIVDICELALAEAADFFTNLKLDPHARKIAGEVLLEIQTRLKFLVDVGLDYLNLHRAAPTLSGGEAQRIRLASQIGSGLSGVLYVLDEPTIGLHPRDTRRLVNALQSLKQLGNTLLVVEHDRDVIRSADRLLDFGPRAGRDGGEIVGEGTPGSFGGNGRKRKRAPREAVSPNTKSLTRAYLSGSVAIPVPTNRRPIDPAGWTTYATLAPQPASPGKRRTRKSKKRRNAKGAPPAPRNLQTHNPDETDVPWLIVRGARQNNLRNLDIPIPLRRFVVVTGVSGSGKSSLVGDILHPALANTLQRANLTVGAHADIVGIDALDKVVNVDQSPIGSTPSSNPATYTDAFTWIRELFARLPDSKMRGYQANRFSFNRPGGRCEACEGNGQICIEMHFMPDVWVECEVCEGKRYNPETLAIQFRGKSIADVLDMRVTDALELFQYIPKVRRMLQTLADVGLDYVQLGQAAPTLSGGEAQRVKLAAELGKPQTGRTFYILDEPTTGLHFEDTRKLLEVLHRLVDLGNTVLVVEHNLDVIKSADWLIDLGPEAGERGGTLVASGPPEHVVDVAASHTGRELAPILAEGPTAIRERYDPTQHIEREIAADRQRYGDVGKDVRMPWQEDGKRWHLEQRGTRDGKHRQWDPDALEYVIAQCEQLPGFAPANWSNRASIEVKAPNAKTWFLHALTGGEWLLELYFLAPRGTFKQRPLDRKLGLKTLDQRDDLETYGDWPRVDIRARRGNIDAIVIYPHDRAEIDTPAFRAFLKQAADAYFEGFGIERESVSTPRASRSRKRNAPSRGTKRS